MGAKGSKEEAKGPEETKDPERVKEPQGPEETRESAERLETTLSLTRHCPSYFEGTRFVQVPNETFERKVVTSRLPDGSFQTVATGGDKPELKVYHDGDANYVHMNVCACERLHSNNPETKYVQNYSYCISEISWCLRENKTVDGAVLTDEARRVMLATLLTPERVVCFSYYAFCKTTFVKFTAGKIGGSVTFLGKVKITDDGAYMDTLTFEKVHSELDSVIESIPSDKADHMSCRANIKFSPHLMREVCAKFSKN